MFNFDLLFLKNASFPIIIIKKCFKIVKKSKKMHMYFFHFLPSISLKWRCFLIFAWLSKKKGNLTKKLFNFNLFFIKNASFPIIIIIKCFKIVKIEISSKLKYLGIVTPPDRPCRPKCSNFRTPILRILT